MADNVASNAGSGGATWAADDISSVYYARGKIVLGADGSNDGDVSASNPMPVKGTGTAGTANSGVLTIQGIASMTAVQVSDGGGSLTVDGTVAATQSGTWNVGTVTTITNVVHIDDNASTISIDDGAGSITVDGTVAATQSGTWNVTNVSGTVSLPTGAATAAKQPAPGTAGTASTDVLTVQGITSMTPLLVNGSGVTQPISAASLPLPTGAATAAKQAALGTAGSASSDVLTVQGVSSMTPLQVADNGGSLTVDGTVAVSGTVTTAARAPTTDGMVAFLSTSAIYNGVNAALVTKRARATATSSGNTQVIAAVTSTKLRVLSWSASSNSTVNIEFRTGASTAISCLRYLVQYGGAGRSFNPLGVMETASGEALNINLSGAGTVSVEVEYVEIP